jgi:hypothetical protein
MNDLSDQQERKDATNEIPDLQPQSISRLKQTPTENKRLPGENADLCRHSRKCQVCRHPNRDAIEWAFINWRRPRGLAEVYQLSGDSLYRHAHALNLYSRRANNLRSVLENVLERGVETQVTGDTLLRAVRAYTCITDDNKWVEPATQVIFSTKPIQETPPARTTVRIAAPPDPSSTIDVRGEDPGLNPQLMQSNRNCHELENELTR